MTRERHSRFPRRTAFLSATFLSLGALLAASLAAQADSWETRVPVPGARAAHSAVWTGREMIVFGGGIDGTFLNTGGRYLAASNTWRTTSLSKAPSPRWFHAAVWTGSEMLVWGGRPSFPGYENRNDGGRYNPVSNTWRPVNTSGAPTARSQCAAVWTGTEMIIWGGATDGGIELNDGARYNPRTDLWVIVWGGQSDLSTIVNSGARWHGTSGAWTATTQENAPGKRQFWRPDLGVWTGEGLLICAGSDYPTSLDSTHLYRPADTNDPPPPASCVAPPGGLVGWWPLDGAANDLANGNFLTLSGAANFVPGRVRQALQFDGASTYGTAAASSALNVGLGDGFSIETWVNPTDVTYRPII